jgi:hypothetical protein
MLITFAYRGEYHHVAAESIPEALDIVTEEYSVHFRREAYIVNIHDPNAVPLPRVPHPRRPAETIATAVSVLAILGFLLILLALYTDAV